MWEEVVVVILRHYPDISMDGLKKIRGRTVILPEWIQKIKMSFAQYCKVRNCDFVGPFSWLVNNSTYYSLPQKVVSLPFMTPEYSLLCLPAIGPYPAPDKSNHTLFLSNINLNSIVHLRPDLVSGIFPSRYLKRMHFSSLHMWYTWGSTHLVFI
jgi:hypothetical protein